MRAGDLDRRIALQTRTVTYDEYGGEVATWAERLVWAKREDLGGNELIRAGQMAAEIETRFTIRRTPSPISATMRVRDGEQLFEIVRPPAEIGTRAEGYELVCKSLDRSGTTG